MNARKTLLKYHVASETIASRYHRDGAGSMTACDARRAFGRARLKGEPRNSFENLRRRSRGRLGTVFPPGRVKVDPNPRGRNLALSGSEREDQSTFSPGTEGLVLRSRSDIPRIDLRSVPTAAN